MAPTRTGPSTSCCSTSAANLDGNGDKLNGTVRDLSTALSTLSGSRDDLFGTVKNLQSFTSMLASNNAQVRRLNSDLATVAVQLGEERENLKATLESLGVAVDEVSGFVSDNRALLKSNLDRAVTVTGSFAKNRQSLAQVLENAPVALSNLQNAYHPETGTLDTRNNAKGLDDPLLLVCSILTGPTRTGNTRLCDSLKKAVLPKLPTAPVAAERLCAARQPAAGRAGQPSRCRPDARRTARRFPMTYAVRSRPRAALAAVVLGLARPRRLQRLRPPAAGRGRHRRRLLHGDRRVRRRARPRAAVVGQGQPGDRRLRRGHPGHRVDRDGAAAPSRARSCCPTTPPQS